MSNRNTNITLATLRNLPPKDRDWFIRDAKIKGFQIKVPPSGKAVFQVEARLGGTGKVKKYKISDVGAISLKAAQEKAQVALDKIRSGIDPLEEKRAQTHAGKTLEQLINDYFQSKELKERTLKDYQIITKKRLKHWLKRRVSDITKHEIRDWYLRGKTKAPTQNEHAFRFLNALMNFAKGLEIISENPCHLVTDVRMRYPIKKKNSHIEVSHDLEKFFTALTKYNFNKDSEQVARDLIMLILATGLRSTEARSIVWTNVDFKRKKFTIPNTKNGSPHIVPMTNLTYSLFRHRQENKTESKYVFRIKRASKSGYVTNFQKTLTNICNDAEINIVTPHDLRRTFATTLNSIGTGYADVKQLMNHKERDITAGIYIQPDTESLRAILIKLTKFYDYKTPVFTNQSCSPYAEGGLRFALYKKGAPTPEPITDQTETREYIKEMEREYWED